MEYIDCGMTTSLRRRLGHDRHALHAHSVELSHPRTQAPLTISAPLATDLEELWLSAPGPSLL
jgi:hypothetical protein